MADKVFIGKARDVMHVTPDKIAFKGTKNEYICGNKTAIFDVNRVIKGDVGKQIEIVSDDACYLLGIDFVIGSTYIIYASGVNSMTKGSNYKYSTDVCSGSGRLNEL